MTAQDHLTQSAAKVQTIEQFKQWVREEVRDVFPHGALACGHGRIHSAGVATDYILAIDFPIEHFAMLCNPAGGLETPLMRRWMMYREPQLLDATAPPDWPEISPAWLAQFRARDLRNAAVHAVFDTTRYLGSYFSFHRLPHAPGSKERDILLAITPVLHDTLVRVVKHVEKLEQQETPDWQRLTQREIEMLEWIARGMSNAEIAEHLDLSENTVKHHISNIFEKTNLTSRSSLMSAFAKHPPGFISKGTKVL